MRFCEILGGFRVPVSAEETVLLALAEHKPISSEAMDERQQELARQMVTRGILRRSVQKGQNLFVPNFDPNLRRF